MYCKNCGSSVPDGSKFCLQCGTPVDSSATAVPKNTDVPESSLPTVTIGSKKISLKLIAKLAVLLALVCFLFPFMTISCLDTKVNISGTDMIFGDKNVSEKADENASSHSNLFNIFVCASAICGVGAVVVRKEKISAALSAGAGFMLILFRMSAKVYYKINDSTLKSLEGHGLEVSFTFFLYFTVILFLAAAVLTMFCKMKAKSSSPPD